ncbi:MAG: acetyltransferase [Cytophagaceae bacterium]|nr:acetyltransferase [Cytophagaceae bacterium]MDW8455819.1 acetyltransferase [Cytophagaceae bacterium]
MSKLLIIGAGGHAISILDVALQCNDFADIYIYEKFPKGLTNIHGYALHAELPQDRSDYDCIIAIGDNSKRKDVFDSLKDVKYTNIISPISYVSNSASIKEGSFVAHSAHVGPDVIIGVNCIINTKAVIEHEVQIGNHVHISPSATICGQCVVGDLCWIGAGAVVINNIFVCSNTVIGAGAVVTSNIHEPGVYVGTPARKIR